MNEKAKELLVRLYDSWKGSSEWGANRTGELQTYCDSIRGLLTPADGNINNDKVSELLYGKPSLTVGSVKKPVGAPSLGSAPSSFPEVCRASPKDYAGIANKYLIKGDPVATKIKLTDYDAFFNAFVNAGKAKDGKTEKDKPRPKMVINRLVCLLFPNQFVQVPDEGKVNVIYNDLKDIGAISEDDDDGKEEDADTWFSQNTEIMTALKKHLQDDSADDGHEKPADLDLGCFAYYLHSAFTARNPMARAVVKYGPPGTGKTYSAVRDAKRALLEWSAHATKGKTYLGEKEHVKVIQFHPSYGYEDFIEGLRPTRELRPSGKEDKTEPEKEVATYPLRLVNGEFKKFCIKAGQYEIDLFKYLKKMPEDKKGDGTYKDCTVSDLLDMTVEEIHKIFGDKKDEHWTFLKSVDGNLPLREALPPYYFIIDEINRAELSRVFGELMFCIENRGPAGAVSTQYAGLNDKETGMLNLGSADEGNEADWRFFVPSNVHIVGTMNVIDRSVESFDFALRRRFVWERDDPDPSVIRVFVDELAAKRRLDSDAQGKIANALIEGLEALNEKIREMINEKRSGLGDDWCIGHAFFKDIKYVPCESKTEDAIVKTVRDWVWSNSIRPLLEEYLRGGESDEKDYMNGFRKAFFQEKSKDKKGNGAAGEGDDEEQAK